MRVIPETLGKADPPAAVARHLPDVPVASSIALERDLGHSGVANLGIRIAFVRTAKARTRDRRWKKKRVCG
jgi:hypothetical protein